MVVGVRRRASRLKLRTSLTDSIAEKTHYDIQLAGDNPFGEVTDATLQISAPNTKLEFIEEDRPASYADGTLSLKYDGSTFRFDLEKSRDKAATAAFIVTYQEDEKTIYNGLLISPVSDGSVLNKRIGVFEDFELALEDFKRIEIGMVVLK